MSCHAKVRRVPHALHTESVSAGDAPFCEKSTFRGSFIIPNAKARENSNANSCILETYFLSTVRQSMPIFSRRRVFRGIVVHFPLILYVCPSVCMSEGGGFAKPFAWRAGL